MQEQHRAYLRSLKEDGVLIASGPLDPRTGGALLVRVPDDDVHRALDAIRDRDPYVTSGVAQRRGTLSGATRARSSATVVITFSRRRG